jgi:glycosyltransferase involved in cell wall biosynthesis
MPTEKAYGIQIAKMCEAFAMQNLQVTLLIPYRRGSDANRIYKDYDVSGFQIKKSYSPDFYLPGKMDKLAFIVKNIISALVLCFWVLRQNPDFIFSRDELPLYFFSYFKKNIVFEAHKFSVYRKIFYKRFKKIGIKSVVLTKELKEAFIKFGFDEKNILVASDGVDIEEFSVKESKNECRTLLNLPKDKKIIGYVGRLRTMGMEKGIDFLINSFSSLLLEIPNLALVIVGGGKKEDIEKYKNMATSGNIPGTKIFFVGQKEHDQIPFYLRAFDVLAMPFPKTTHYSLYMSPLKLFEYMAAGRPIIAPDLSSIKEILNSGNAVLYESENSRSFVEAISKVLKDDKLAEKISETIFCEAKKYSWDDRAKKIINFI